MDLEIDSDIGFNGSCVLGYTRVFQRLAKLATGWI
jgi:hypothetical protein